MSSPVAGGAVVGGVVGAVVGAVVPGGPVVAVVVGAVGAGVVGGAVAGGAVVGGAVVVGSGGGTDAAPRSKMARSVAASTMPVCGTPIDAWNARTAAMVAAEYEPSMAPS